MSLAGGREILSIPGPTTVPDRVLSAMHRPAVDIYSGPLVDLTDHCLAELRGLFAVGDGRAYIYAANGHGAWEAALSNVLSRGDRILVLESGRFAAGWGQMAGDLGVEVTTLAGDWRRAVDPAAVEDALRKDTEHRIKAILVVQVDTASGVVNDIPAISAARAAAGHPALLMADCIASLACMPFDMAAWDVDVAVSGSQKGLMTPPGLGFVAARGRAFEAHGRADLRTRYWDWTERDGPEHYQKYCGTPPEHLLFGLTEALAMLREEGLDAVHARHRLLAGMVHAAVDGWSVPDGIACNVIDPAHRSPSVTAVLLPPGIDPETVRGAASRTCGVVLGSGIGALDGKGFRIAHMGHCNAGATLGVLGAVETALAMVGIDHTPGGVQAAVRHLQEVTAKAG